MVYCQYTRFELISFRLREAMDAYEAKTGIHLTYDELSQLTGISTNTLKSIATRHSYNTTLLNLSKISEVLNINPVEYLIWSTSSE